MNNRRPQPQPNRNIKKRRRKKRPNYIPLITAIFILAALLIIILQCTGREEKPGETVTERVISMSAPEVVATEEKIEIIELDEEIYSYASVLYNLTTNSYVCEKNMEEVTYPASLTKIMTAIVAIENIDATKYFDTYITLDADIFDYITTANASVAGFKVGERVRIIDLLYGVVLPSGGDA